MEEPKKAIKDGSSEDYWQKKGGRDCENAEFHVEKIFDTTVSAKEKETRSVYKSSFFCLFW
ncbi:hypothetical protein MASR1M65_21350 [Saprospiraceae bacterium]